jgi:broad specificity phosphatase PhoE
MTRVVLARHGETEWNRVERFRGRTDIELNETGHRQAQAVAQRLSSWQTEAIYSSPLKRALQTAQPIAQACGLEVQGLEGIIDIDYGDCAGLSPEEFSTRHPDLFEKWRDAPQRVRFPGGEGLEDVRRRAWRAVEEICSTHEDGTLILVSHVVVNRVLICAALGVGNSSFWKIGQDNAAVNVIEAEQGGYRLLLLNDTCHLESLFERHI